MIFALVFKNKEQMNTYTIFLKIIIKVCSERKNDFCCILRVLHVENSPTKLDFFFVQLNRKNINSATHIFGTSLIFFLKVVVVPDFLLHSTIVTTIFISLSKKL